MAYGLALSRGRVTTVAALTFATETVIPAVIGLVALGDRVVPGQAPTAAVAFVVTLGGCIALAGRAEPTEPATPSDDVRTKPSARQDISQQP